MTYYALLIFIIIFILFVLFLFLLKRKINKLESKILFKFEEKNNQIPSIYEITKGYLNKHDEIFKEILILKKKDFSENLFLRTISEKTKTYKLIHNELNFIFRVCNKHPKINKNAKFLFIKDNIIEKSSDIWDNLIIYKKITTQFNRMIIFKNLTIIWLLIPINKIKLL